MKKRTYVFGTLAALVAVTGCCSIRAREQARLMEDLGWREREVCMVAGLLSREGGPPMMKSAPTTAEGWRRVIVERRIWLEGLNRGRFWELDRKYIDLCLRRQCQIGPDPNICSKASRDALCEYYRGKHETGDELPRRGTSGDTPKRANVNGILISAGMSYKEVISKLGEPTFGYAQVARVRYIDRNNPYKWHTLSFTKKRAGFLTGITCEYTDDLEPVVPR